MDAGHRRQACCPRLAARCLSGPFRAALVTADGRTLYGVVDGIPVMLPGLGIAAAQLGGR